MNIPCGIGSPQAPETKKGSLSVRLREIQSGLRESASILNEVEDLVFLPQPQTVDNTAPTTPLKSPVTTVDAELASVYDSVSLINNRMIAVLNVLNQNLDTELRLS